MTENHQLEQNLRLPISRIPNEILARIFFSLRDRCVRIAERRCRHGVSCLKGWVGLTHVCRVWREVALDNSLLWCHIDVVPSLRRWIPELLRRSKQSPLTVVITTKGPDEHNSLAEVNKHAGRIGELEMVYPKQETKPPSNSDFQNSETLAIYPTFTSSFFFPHFRTERLNRLVLHGCAIDWDSRWLQGLTHLKLVDTPYYAKSVCHEYIPILSRLPLLETLYISRSFHSYGAGVQTHQATKVHLQHLQRLYVGCSVRDMAEFLPCLVVPPSCKLRLSPDDNFIEDNFRAVLSWVSNQLRVTTISLPTSDASDQGQYMRSVHLSSNRDNDLEIKGFRDILSHEQSRTADPILEFSFWQNFDIQDFLSLLPLGGITLLGVSDVELSSNAWTVTFGSIETLTTVYLDDDTSPFFNALNPAISNTRAVGTLPFPALTSVSVNHRDLDPLLLLDELRVRSELGAKQLQDLQIRFSRYGSVPPDHLLVQLRELISHVEIQEMSGSLDTGYSSSDW